MGNYSVQVAYGIDVVWFLLCFCLILSHKRAKQTILSQNLELVKSVSLAELTFIKASPAKLATSAGFRLFDKTICIVFL